MIYNRDVIYTNSGSVLALLHVEEISFLVDEADLVVDALTDDLHMIVYMCSGRVHTISLNVMKKYAGYTYPISNEELRHAICEKWLFILKGK